MKTCHTKVDVLEDGNALKVNTPVLSGKHFFCHCAICGGGFEDYSQLSSHESEKHNFACLLCEECFMVELDLNEHVTTNHINHEIQCYECGLTLKDATGLNEHKETQHNDELSEKEVLNERIRNLGTELKEKSILLSIALEVCEEEKRDKGQTTQ